MLDRQNHKANKEAQTAALAIPATAQNACGADPTPRAILLPAPIHRKMRTK